MQVIGIIAKDVFQKFLSIINIPNFSTGTELRVGGAPSPAQLGFTHWIPSSGDTNGINNLSNGSQAQQIRNKQTKFVQGLKQIENQKRQQMGSSGGDGMGSNQYSSNNYSNQTSGLIKKLDPISNTPVQNIQMPEVPIPPVVTETRVNSQYKTIRESQFTRSGDKSHIIVRTFKQRAKLMRLFRWIVNDSMNDNDDNNNFKSSGYNNYDNNGDRTTRIDMFLKTSHSHAGVHVETKSKRLFFSFPSTKWQVDRSKDDVGMILVTCREHYDFVEYLC